MKASSIAAGHDLLYMDAQIDLTDKASTISQSMIVCLACSLV